MRKRERGVTLVELMTVVIVVAILASIAIPSYRTYLLRSQRTAAKTALMNIQAAQEKFFLQNNRYSSSLTAAPVDGGLGLPGVTEGGYYDLAINAPGGTMFTATAKPRVGGGQTEDKKCTEFSIDQNGKRVALQGATDNTETCWR